jgi:class 3 adenylate cyclase
LLSAVASAARCTIGDGAAICQTSVTSGETITDVNVNQEAAAGLLATTQICASCGAHSSSTGKFCSECGARLTQATHSAEYKQVTVLFADVVRSMDIAATLDMERLREVMTELVERSAAVVRRYGGGSVEFTGDGVMAVFGAPVALEDHAFRACLAALAIQEEADCMAGEVQRRDGVALRLRVGLNSGRVIAGEIGSGALGYSAIGEQVGLGQRMESVAPPGGVMLSESTARLVEDKVILGEPEWVRIKGADEPVSARQLLGIEPTHALVRDTESSLVGRRWEMAALEAMVDRAVGGRGAVVNVVGPPGIGKSRMARDVAAHVAARGVKVVWAFCESHAREVPFHLVTRLLRAGTGVADLDGQAARTQLRDQLPGAEADDLLLLDDLLGVADSDVPLPRVDPDARRRRLTALVNTMSLSRRAPVLFIIEDAHWIDAVSESMLTDFLTVIPHSPSMVLITSRPEYEGALMRVHGAQTIALAPLGDSDAAALIGELLGLDTSVGQLVEMIAERADGNPFFAEEMVRELVQRGVLAGERGDYICRTDVAEVSVPATVQAAIEARIDRLNNQAKRIVHAASVIGARFEAELLAALEADAVLDELLAAELIDQVRFTPTAEYAFHHPLIRAVAYESQLKSDRAELHRRVAAAIESRDPAAAEENAALIAEHLETAGDLHAAYGWHMRAAAWATSRDIFAARRGWERAGRIADTLPTDHPNRVAMRIAPRTMLCATAYRVRANDVAAAPFDELRQLCTAAGDKASLAIAMAGQVMARAYQGRIRVASPLASEAMSLIESLGDPTLTVGLSYPAVYAKMESGEWPDVLRWSQRMIDLADGDPFKGNFIFGSPLALAFTSRAMARQCLGRPGWREDLRHALDMARSADPLTYAAVVALGYCSGIPNGTLAADDRAVPQIEDAVRIAQRSGNDTAMAFARMSLGVTLAHRQAAAERDRGRILLAEVSEVFARDVHNLADRPLVDVYAAREKARQGDLDEAIPLMHTAVDELASEGQLLSWGIPATGVLVEALLDRGTDSDVTEAEAAIGRLAAAPAEEDVAMRDIWLLRLRALLSRARSDDIGYRDLVTRYRAMAKSLGFEGHNEWAVDMLEGREA